jgi:hypothetical protein
MICSFHNELRSHILSRLSATQDNLAVNEGTKPTEDEQAYTKSNSEENLEDDVNKWSSEKLS